MNVSAEVITSMVLVAYGITGCDTVSYPFNRGKKRVFQDLVANCAARQSLASYGQYDPSCDDPMEVEFEPARRLFVSLYGKQGYNDMNHPRAHMYGSKSDLCHLPPTEDAFKLHILRGLYQLIIWKSAHLSDAKYPDVCLFGRKLSQNGFLEVVPSTLPAKPQAATSKKFCDCKKGRCLKNCPCEKAKVICFISCGCSGQVSKCGRLERDVVLH